MNGIIEKLNYSDGAYWGDPNKMRFRSVIDSFDDNSEVGDDERLIRTNFNLTLSGYLLSEKGINKSTTNKFVTPRSVQFTETLTDEV